MYGTLGALPSILQGAAQRETLSPDQLARLQAQGIPVKAAQVNASSVLVPLSLGLAAAFLFTGGGRRSLW